MYYICTYDKYIYNMYIYIIIINACFPPTPVTTQQTSSSPASKSSVPKPSIAFAPVKQTHLRCPNTSYKFCRSAQVRETKMQTYNYNSYPMTDPWCCYIWLAYIYISHQYTPVMLAFFYQHHGCYGFGFFGFCTCKSSCKSSIIKDSDDSEHHQGKC